LKVKLRKHNVYPLSQQELDSLIGSGIKIKKLITIVDVELTKYNILIENATGEERELLEQNKAVMEKLKTKLQEAKGNGEGIKAVQ
jgi:hypothetical protein